MKYWDKLSGTSFRQHVIDAMTGEEELVMIPEPENEHDKYAVRVETTDGVMVGWIPKGKNENISKALQQSTEVTIDAFTITGGQTDENGEQMNYGVNVQIHFHKPKDFSSYKLLTPDIGDGHVYFDEENHIYYNEQGGLMTSGSRLEEEEAGKIDLSYALKAMAKSTGIDKNKIEELWEMNGEFSARLGSVVHDAFDYYIKNKQVMKHYDHVRERPHLCTNWFPNVVGKIMDDYIETHDLDNAQSEVFVRYGNYCGYIDQLIYLDKDTVIINDYKFINKLKNVKTKSFGSVPKYSVQQSLYAKILELNGYDVAQINLNTYDGDEWKDVKLERLDIEIPKPS